MKFWPLPELTRPTLERRKTLRHLRSINRNMIIHFANQSQTCQLLKILTRSLYVASFLAIFFFFFFLKIPVRCIFPGHFHFFSLLSRSVSPYTGFFLAICIFTLLRCCSYSLNSGSDLARLFSFPLSTVLLPQFLALYRLFITPITGWLLYTVTICIREVVHLSITCEQLISWARYAWLHSSAWGALVGD